MQNTTLRRHKRQIVKVNCREEERNGKVKEKLNYGKEGTLKMYWKRRGHKWLSKGKVNDGSEGKGIKGVC